MKKVRKSLPVVAFVVGIGTAFAFNQQQTTYQLLESGQIVDEQTALGECPGEEEACAVQITGPNPGSFLFRNPE